MGRKIKDIKNQKFGKLTALQYDHFKGVSYWKCRCDCGNIRIVRLNCLTAGLVTECSTCRVRKIKVKDDFDGSRIKKDITDQTFGELSVTGFDHFYNDMSYWRCKCNCGNEKIVARSNLASGTIKSCGCLKKKRNNKNG